MQYSRNQGQIHVWHRDHLCHWHILHISERYTSLNWQYDGEHTLLFILPTAAAVLMQRPQTQCNIDLRR